MEFVRAMSFYQDINEGLRANPKTWLITGVAGFIGSNLLEALLGLNQKVVGVDNFATGFRINIEQVLFGLNEQARKNFLFVEGDLCDYSLCKEIVKGVDYVLHQAALGSVPRSIRDPIATHNANVCTFLNMLTAAKDSDISRFIYASSSSVYGSSLELPKREDIIGSPLSPYALTKQVCEMYANVFCKVYTIKPIGLRYFNVFGARQDANGAYSAVIPRWISQMLKSEPCIIFGDGKTSRDFCYVTNIVQANILAALSELDTSSSEVFNIACSQQCSLIELYKLIQDCLSTCLGKPPNTELQFSDFRAGDVRHSLADITKASQKLGYCPEYSLEKGMDETVRWYLAQEKSRNCS